MQSSTILFLFCCLLGLIPLQAQVIDDFSDGDFTQNPTWTGETGLFQVNPAFELQSNGNTAITNTIYLSTPNTRLDATEWRFRLRYGFNPSTSNLMRVYLVSDQANLSGPLNGYFVQIGETGSDDSIDLFRQDGASNTRLIDGSTGQLGSGVDVWVQVIRDNAGNWTLNADNNGNGLFTTEGDTTDITYTTTAHFGIFIKYTSTRTTSFFADDFYVGEVIQDTTAPALNSLEWLSQTEVEAIFSEPLEMLSAENTNNYVLDNGIGTPIDVQQDGTNPARVVLDFATSFVNNTSYTLTVSNVKDLSGNAINPPVSDSFVYFIPEVADSRDVIFNEIFADPTPPLGLPNAEFLELYNRSTKTVDLAGWTLDNGTTVGTLPTYQFSPGTYLVVARSDQAAQFEVFGTAISPSSWPALVNTGDNLGLRSSEGVLIDTVDYRNDWYGDPVKAAGGFSLELINPENETCPPAANWRGSNNIAGGTPGMENSIFSMAGDTLAPTLVSAFVISPNVVEVCFSESMDAASVSLASHYTVDNGIGSPIGAQVQDADIRCLNLAFATGLQAGIIYTLSISGVQDCSGNEVAAPQTAQLIIGGAAEELEVIITEIFPDFSPQVGLPEAEFVEIYNRSTEALSLNGWTLTDGSSDAVFANTVMLPGEFLILCEEGDSADFATFGKVLTAPDFPSLNNATDSLYLRDDLGNTIDFVFYADNWYVDSEKEDGGYSLERIDRDFVGCNLAGNWRASASLTGGTPGQANSVAGSFMDTQSPQITAVEIIDANTLRLVFDEQMDALSLENLAAYSVDQGIGVPLLAIATLPHLQSVELVLDASLSTNVIYTLTFTGLSDCSGNALNGSRAFGLPVPVEAGDVLLNEILFNPYTGGADFVEIYNNSSKILDLSELRIGEIFPETDSIFNADPIAERSVLFLPGTILCLTADVAFQQATYFPPSTAVFYEMSSFPSYDDSKGEVVIFTGSGLQLDRFRYEDDFQFPSLSDENGVSLERISLDRPTQDPGNWHSAASTVLFATPGYENSQVLNLSESPSAVSLEKSTFSPNGDGDDDVLAINYDFDFIGANVRVSIFDSQGRPITVLMQNSLLSPEPGTIFWDGRDDHNTKADIGIYVVLFEVSNQESGKKEVYKLACVLADRL